MVFIHRTNNMSWFCLDIVIIIIIIITATIYYYYYLLFITCHYYYLLQFTPKLVYPFSGFY